jgi:hypothetical protein
MAKSIFRANIKWSFALSALTEDGTSVHLIYTVVPLFINQCPLLINRGYKTADVFS